MLYIWICFISVGSTTADSTYDAGLIINLSIQCTEIILRDDPKIREQHARHQITRPLSITTLGIDQQHPANNNLHHKQRRSLARRSCLPCHEIFSTFKVQLLFEGKWWQIRSDGGLSHPSKRRREWPSMQILHCIWSRRACWVKAKDNPSFRTGMDPLRYDNIENHVRNQHPLKWEYGDAKTRWKHTLQYEECNSFSADVASPSSSTYKRHFFPPKSAGSGQHSRQPLVNTISKDIVELITGKMMYSTLMKVPTTRSQRRASCPEMVRIAALSMFFQRRNRATSTRHTRLTVLQSEMPWLLIVLQVFHGQKIALSLFEQTNAGGGGDDEESPEKYTYVATITKPLLFQLAVRYVS